MSGFLETAAPVGQRTLDAFVQGAAAPAPADEPAAYDDEQVASELPTLGEWVEGSGGAPVELSLGDWHPSQPSSGGPTTWDCDTCTYADNAAGAACCEACGKPRGAAWADDGEERLVRCGKCGKMVAREDSVEHSDWHLAVELQQGEEAVERRRLRGPGKRQQQTKLDTYLSGSDGYTQRRRLL